MNLQCTYCQAAMDEGAIDRDRQIGLCDACHRMVDLRAQITAGEVADSPRMHESVSLPAGMAIEDDAAVLLIQRRWLRTRHFVFLLVIGALTAWVAVQWADTGSSPWLLVGAFFVAIWNFQLLKMFLNTTTIRVGEGRIDVRHGPIPSLAFKNQSLGAAQIAQLFAAKFGAAYEVGAVLQDGTRVPLVRPLVSQEQALFVEQRLEHRLGIVDFAVADELGAAQAPPGTVPAKLSGAAGAAMTLLLPLGIVGVTLAVFCAVVSSEVEGTLQARGERLGEFVFTPGHCTSGQTRGFYGVELTSREAPGTIVRAMRDPVRGTLLVVERNAGQPIALTPADCKSLQIGIEQTSMSTNEVWVVRGSAQVDCPELAGQIRFDGCH